MIVIQHIQTGERLKYPSTNANIETPTGFIQVQTIPRDFIPSGNQDSSGLMDFHHVYPSYKWENDPLDQDKWRDRI